MTNEAESIYQLKITLNHIKPLIWRRVLVPASASLADLHDVIQAVMPWADAHLYQFRMGTLTFSEPDPYNEDVEDSNSAEVLLSEVLTVPKQKLSYLYDFGDGWEHTILLEEIQPFDLEVIYPQCIDGERACPPDDCGGPPGYATMLEALKDPKHSEHELYLDWVGDEFDPEWFDVEDANDALFLELVWDDGPPITPINRHLVAITPTQAYYDLKEQFQISGAGAPGSEEPTPLAFLVPFASPEEDSEFAELMSMFITYHLLMEGFAPEIVTEVVEKGIDEMFEFAFYPLVFDLDWQSPLMHIPPDFFGEEFAEE